MAILKFNLKNFSTISLVVLSFLLTAFVTSCKDSEDDTEKPKITVVSPSANQTFQLSSVPQIRVEFSATDNDELHEVKVTIKNSKGDVLFSNSKDVDAAVYSFQQNFIPTGITTPLVFVMKIEASDHHNNESEVELSFTVAP